MQTVFNLGHLDKWRGACDHIATYIAVDTNGGIVNNNTKYYDPCSLIAL